MKIHNVLQGSPEWHALRADPRICTASEAPAMMGESKYKTRSDLLREKATGIRPEVDSVTQARFNAGHRAEAAFRPHAEAIIDDELYPVTGTQDIDGMIFLASFDGLTMTGDTLFEHKLWSTDLAGMMDRDDLLGPNWYWQLEHQLLVSGADRALFVTSDGTTDQYRHLWYASFPWRREMLIAGWRQFLVDLDAYEHRGSPTPVAGHAPESLPALRIDLTGMVTASNLDEFRTVALATIDRINTDLQTDADFASAELAVKWCKEVEDRLEAAKQHALSQTASIDALFRMLDDIREMARSKRLNVDKLVKKRKEDIRFEIVQDAQRKLSTLCEGLNLRLGDAWMPVIDGGFAEAIRGKRTITSLHDAVDTALAHAKIQANEIADRIEINRKSLAGEAHDWSFLFPDFAQLCVRETEFFAAILGKRIHEHQDRERERERQREFKIQQDAELKRQQEAAQQQRATEAQEANATPPQPESEPASPVRAWAAPIEEAEAQAQPSFFAAQDLVEAFLDTQKWRSPAARKAASALLTDFVSFSSLQQRAVAESRRREPTAVN